MLKHTLEFEVAALMTRIEEAKRLRRTFRNKLVVIEDGKVWSYPLKGRPAETVASAIKRQSPRRAWSMAMTPRSRKRSPL